MDHVRQKMAFRLVIISHVSAPMAYEPPPRSNPSRLATTLLTACCVLAAAVPFPYTPTAKDAFMSAVTHAVAKDGGRLPARTLGDRVCLIEEGTFAANRVAGDFLPGKSLDLSEFDDQSEGYWTLVVVDDKRSKARLISIGQTTVAWRAVDFFERDDVPRERQMLCVGQLLFKPGHPPQLVN